MGCACGPRDGNAYATPTRPASVRMGVNEAVAEFVHAASRESAYVRIGVQDVLARFVPPVASRSVGYLCT
jgi:hypothetical protein